MNKHIYTNIMDYINPRYTFNFFIGGRGIGKTYSVLKYFYEEDINFLYLRYTNTELDIAVNADLFKQYGDDISFHRLDDGFYSFTKNDKLCGYGMSLSTFKNKRGVDFSDIDYIFLDEFIPEIGSRKVISYVGNVFLNMYETVNRNREFDGKYPVMLIACANSNDIANPLMIDLGLTSVAEEMIRTDNEFFHDLKRGFQLAILKSNPAFYEKKSKTALYKFATKDFTNMSLNNIFTYNDFSNIKDYNLKGMQPVFSIKNKWTLYKKKNDELYYIYPNVIAREIYDINDPIQKQKMLSKYLVWINSKYYKNKIRFSTYEIKNLFIDLFIKL